MKSIYIHIPFCDKICTYCDFVKRVSSNDMKSRYITRIIEDINDSKDKFKDVKTVFIGGGTPTSISNELLVDLLSTINSFTSENIEFSIESNVENLTKEKISILKKYNVNRVSIGVQTFNERLQKIINRFHTYEEVKEVVNNLKQEGIENINIDMIFSIPTQKNTELNKDLELLKSLEVEHVSYYSLILEENTILYHWYENEKIEMQDNLDEANMYEITMSKLKEYGYKQYEISNYCKNKESEHNKTYWKNEEYLAIGLGSHGYENKKRYSITKDMMKYLDKDIIDYKESLSKEDMMGEELMLGLRLMRGVNKENFTKKFNEDIYKVFPVINELKEKGLLKEEKNNISLTEKGILVGNDIFDKFI